MFVGDHSIEKMESLEVLKPPYVFEDRANHLEIKTLSQRIFLEILEIKMLNL
jgi:hypothetical protein